MTDNSHIIKQLAFFPVDREAMRTLLSGSVVIRYKNAGVKAPAMNGESRVVKSASPRYWWLQSGRGGGKSAAVKTFLAQFAEVQPAPDCRGVYFLKQPLQRAENRQPAIHPGFAAPITLAHFWKHHPALLRAKWDIFIGDAEERIPTWTRHQIRVIQPSVCPGQHILPPFVQVGDSGRVKFNPGGVHHQAIHRLSPQSRLHTHITSTCYFMQYIDVIKYIA
jgi:hypothetical protein